MKTTTLSVMLLALSSALFAQELQVASGKGTASPPAAGASFDWAQTSYDFGKIPLNQPATHEFTFVNAGGTPLIITSVVASCGCTVAQYSKDAIEPGESGFVKATFNASKKGVFNKAVTINANTEVGVVRLSITGEVVE